MMKKTLFAALAVILACALSAGAQAQQLKIGTVNMTRLFEKYYKKAQAEALFKKWMEDLEGERKGLASSVQKVEKEYKDLLDRANDQAISSDERDKIKQTAERKFREVKDLEQTYQEWASQAKTRIEEKQRTLTENLVTEIKNAVSAKAKAGSFSLVIDSTAVTGTQTPVILFSNGENDLTDSVLDQLNAAASVLATPSPAEKSPFK